jgi:selenocysteine-specific elongation factor
MDPAVVNALAAKERGTPDDLLETWLRGAPTGVMIRDAAKGAGLSEPDMQSALKALLDLGDVVQLDRDRVIHRSALATATDRGMNALTAYHAANPLRPGMPKEELRGSVGRTVDPKAFAALVSYWQSEGRVTTDQTSVRKADFQVQLNPRQQALLDRVASLYREARFNAPGVEDVAEEVGAPPDAISAMIRVGQDQGVFAKIAEGLYYHRDTVDEAKRIVREQIEKTGSITVSQFRDITGSSRKYALPVMEYFDAVRFTRRRGDERILFET